MLFLVPAFYHRYDDHGLGEYYGVIRGRVFGYAPSTYLEIRAESERTWRWTPPPTYSYDSLDLTISTAEGDELTGKLKVPQMTFVNDDTMMPLSERSFATLLLGSATPDDATVNEIFALLRTAGTGDFPPPRHHYYSFGNDVNRIAGNVAHWSMGKRVPHMLIYWIVIWLLALVFRITRGAKNDGEPGDRDRGRFSPGPSHTTRHAGPHLAVHLLGASSLHLSNRLNKPCSASHWFDMPL